MTLLRDAISACSYADTANTRCDNAENIIYYLTTVGISVLRHRLLCVQEEARLFLEALKRDMLRGPDKDFIT